MIVFTAQQFYTSFSFYWLLTKKIPLSSPFTNIAALAFVLGPNVGPHLSIYYALVNITINQFVFLQGEYMSTFRLENVVVCQKKKIYLLM